MKGISLSILLAVAFILFLIGISIPGINSAGHIILVSAGVLVGFVFYLRVFWDVIHSPGLSRGERTLWTVVILCVPVIGNLLYVLIRKLSASRQGSKQFV
jgi:hypothetical protein